MLSFRKVLLALAAMMVLSSLATAQTPLNCIAQATGTTSIRDIGIAELAGDVLISCTGGVPRGVNEVLPQVNIQVFTSPTINITSKIIGTGAGNWTEALLFVDEPLPADQHICGSTNAPNQAPPGSGQTTTVGVCGAHVGSIGGGTPTYAGGAGPSIMVNTFPGGDGLAFNGCALPGTSSALGACALTYRPNTFLARQAGNNSLIWQGIPIDPPGTTATRFFRMTNVRVNASQLNNPRGLQSPVALVISTSASGVTNPISMPITNPTPTVAIAQTPMNFSAGGPTSFLQCESHNAALISGTTTSPTLSLSLTYTELFNSAFKRRSPAVAIDENTPGDPQVPAPNVPDLLGVAYQTESGHYSLTSKSGNWDFAGMAAPFTGTLTGNVGAGVASHGTRLLFRVHNIPAGVSVFVDAAGDLEQVGTIIDTGFARATSSDANGAGSFGAVPAPNGFVEISQVGGEGFLVWEILETDTNVNEDVVFGVYVAYIANTSAGLPGLGTATGDGQMAPLSTVGIASASAPIPRFVEDPANNGRELFTINACVSNLLFPFVVSNGDFETGLAISNTTKDPFGTEAQTGACTVYFYGTVADEDVCITQPSSSITGGQYLVWTVGGGGDVPAVPGFTGYVIAQCAFQYAHGYAFISDSTLQRFAQGYLALVMDQPVSSRTGSTSESLSQ